jgi:ATP-dependent DNA helicase RecQ
LLWQKRDIGLLTYFIEQLSDPLEKQRSWERYHIIRRFVETARCRHHQICQHFGEMPKWKTCGACDVCIGAPDWLAVEALAKRRKKKKGQFVPAPVNIAAELGGIGKPGASKPVAVQQNIYEAPKKGWSSGPHHDLREYLREWRRGMAGKQGVPSYVVMLDVTMDELCEKRPDTLEKLLKISGIGERKVELYGKQILEALKRFEAGERATERERSTVKPAEETLRLLQEGRSFQEIAQARGRQMGSVVDLVIRLYERGEVEFQESWVDAERRKKIEAACETLGMQGLKPLKEALPPEISYEEIKLVIARLRSEEEESA